MQRKEIITELTILYSRIPIEKIEIFKEFLLIINLQNISGNSIREDKMLEIFRRLSGASMLYDWSGLKDNIINYLHAHPDEKDFNYAMDIPKYTKLGEVLSEFSQQKLKCDNRSHFFQSLRSLVQ